MTSDEMPKPVTCETQKGHIYGHNGACVFCKESRADIVPDDKDVAEAFEAEYRTGEALIDNEVLAKNENGDYESALARVCFKWFRKGHAATAKRDCEGLVRALEFYAAHKHYRERWFEGEGEYQNVCIEDGETAINAISEYRNGRVE